MKDNILVLSLFNILPLLAFSLGSAPKEYGNDYRPIVPWLILGAVGLIAILVIIIIVKKLRKR